MCWASHFVHGPSIFVCAQSFHLCAIILIRAWSSSSFEWSWWTVLAGLSSCCLSGVIVSTGAHQSWVRARCRPWVEGGGLCMGGHCHLGWGIVIRGWGIAICGWDITFRGWGLSLSVGCGACCLLWFERRGLRVIVDVHMGGGHSRGWWAWCGGSCVWGFMCGGVRVCGGSCGCGLSHRWWGFKWLVGACRPLVEGHHWMGLRCGGLGVVVCGVVSVVPLLCGQGFVVWLRKPLSTWHAHPGVPHQLLGGGCCCHPSLFPGSWAFVVIDVAHPDGRATSAIWWWVSWSVSALLASLSMSMSWGWDSPGVLYRGGGRGGGMG